jgi:hypothetical protein
MGIKSAISRISKLRRARIALLGVGATFLIGAVFYHFRPSAVDRLQPFIGKDLRTLSEAEQIKFDNIIGRLIPQARVFHYPKRPSTWSLSDWYDYLTAKPYPSPFDVSSWYLWKVIDAQGQTRLIFFQGRPLFMIPGESMARIFVMDIEGNLLTESEFPTGYRIIMHDARWLEETGHGFPCLVVSSSPSLHGADITCQYYALLDRTFALVRLESSAGECVRPNYLNPDPTIGPPILKRTAEQWETAFHSGDRPELLRSLLWLSGHRSDPRIRYSELWPDGYDDSSLALTVRARPGVRAAVEALIHSEDSWVKEAAQLAWKVITDPDK